MPALWETIDAAALGFPKILPEHLASDISGSISVWIPAMKVKGTADYYTTLRRNDWITKFLKEGGDPSKLIVHHLAYDDGVINPLWGKEYLLKWIKKMKDWGIKYIVPPDFSAWADMPYVLQLYNYYRSTVIARDFADHGFKLVPLLYWSAPKLQHIPMSMWPTKIPIAIVDGQHINTAGLEINRRLFWSGVEKMYSTLNVRRLLLYANNPSASVEWAHHTGRKIEFLASARRMQDILIRTLKKHPPVAKAET